MSRGINAPGTYMAVREQLASAAQKGGRGRHREAAQMLERSVELLSALAARHREAEAKTKEADDAR